jgi:hypothetical protein
MIRVSIDVHDSIHFKGKEAAEWKAIIITGKRG